MLTVQFEDIQTYVYTFHYFGLWSSFLLVNAVFHFTLAQLLAYTNISSILILLHYIWAFVTLSLFVVYIVLLRKHPAWSATPLIFAGIIEIAFCVDLWTFTGEFTRDYILTLMAIFRGIYLILTIKWLFHQQEWRKMVKDQSS